MKEKVRGLFYEEKPKEGLLRKEVDHLAAGILHHRKWEQIANEALPDRRKDKL